MTRKPIVERKALNRPSRTRTQHTGLAVIKPLSAAKAREPSSQLIGSVFHSVTAQRNSRRMIGVWSRGGQPDMILGERERIVGVVAARLAEDGYSLTDAGRHAIGSTKACGVAPLLAASGQHHG